MSRVAIIASNAITAAVTAAVTSMYWVGTYGGRPSEAPQSAPPATAVATDVSAPPASARLEPLQIGPTGVAIPVAGIRQSQLTDTYTQARAGGRRVHDAIDIIAPAGTPVFAAAPGIVEKLFFSRGGGGITVYVRSPDRRWSYYYAHLKDYAPGLKEGQKVRQGDLLGTVGSTGNANPAGPHLHFAVHRMEPGDRWWQGRAINPYPLLAGNGGSR